MHTSGQSNQAASGKGKTMANNEFNWGEGLFYDGTGDGKRKRKKDPYENPLGLSSETPGMIRDTEETLRQSKETDNAIGETARLASKPLPSVKIPDPVIPPEPQTEIPPAQTDTAPQKNSVNLFGYGTKSCDTRPTEGEKRDKNYEDSLKIDGGNEGYTMPPIKPSTGNVESYPGEREKLQEHNANEGFTIGNKSRTDEESERRIEETAAFLERFFKGNEKEQRYANGLPAPGEEHKSILVMYTDAKSKSDNAMQGDWGKTVKNLNGSSFGQGVMDVYHGGARGMYELGNEGLTILGEMNKPKPFVPFPYPTTPYALLDRLQQNFPEDKKLDSRYELYKMKKNLRAGAEEHRQAQSSDYKAAGWSRHQGYLGVWGLGEFARDMPAIFMAGKILMSAGKKWTGLYSALEGGVSELTDHYDKEVDKYMKMPQQEMERYPEYIQAKREGKSEEQARFRAADPRAKRGALMSFFTGVIKGMMKYGVNYLTGSAADGIVTRYVQDFLGGRAVDYFGDYMKGGEEDE